MHLGRNLLFYGDNVDVLRNRIPSASVDLIYLDPPFNSNRSYNVLFRSRSGAEAQAQIEAFDDTWIWSQETERVYQELVQGGAPVKVADALEAMRKLLGDNDLLAYLTMMSARMVELHRVLKPTGSLYLHCDPTASHYLKLLLDAVFGPEHFRSEIIWRRTSSHNDLAQGRRQHGRIHDVLLFYSRGQEWTWNPVYVAYDPDYVAKKYPYTEPGTNRNAVALGSTAVRATTTTAWPGDLVGCGQRRWRSRLSGKLLILRLTTRGKARSRRGGSRCRSASATACRVPLASRRGGKRGLTGDLAPRDVQAAGKRQPVRVDLAVQGGLVHERADGVMDQQVRPDLLADPVGMAAAQHHPGAALMGLELIQRGLQLPPLGIQRRQLGRGCPVRIQDGGDQPVALRLTSAARIVQPVVHDPHRHPLVLGLALAQFAAPGAILQDLQHLQLDVLAAAPHQLRPRRLEGTPQLKTAQALVDQQQHPRPQRASQRRRQRALARALAQVQPAHGRVHDRMGAALHQPHQPHLRERPRA